MDILIIKLDLSFLKIALVILKIKTFLVSPGKSPLRKLPFLLPSFTDITSFPPNCAGAASQAFDFSDFLHAAQDAANHVAAYAGAGAF
jgi:hypothetical protein